MTRIPFGRLGKLLTGDLFTDAVHRRMLATDASIFSLQPAAVAYPRTEADVIAVVRFARDHGVPVHARGAGSGLCGAAIGSGIVVDFSRYMHRLLSLDIQGRRFTCEPGYRLGELDRALAGSGLFFPPDPSSGEYATFGGMAGTNASGAHSVKYGNVSDYLADADVVLGTGTSIRLSEVRGLRRGELPENLRDLWRLYETHREAIQRAYPDVRNNVAGYQLNGLVRNERLCLERLFAGAEGTLGLATRLTFRLLEKPSFDSLVVAYFDDIITASRAVQRILPMGPSGIEVMDKSLLKLARAEDPALRRGIPSNVDNVLLIEFDAATLDDCAALAAEALDLLETGGLTRKAHLAVTPAEKSRFWAVRKAAVPILYRLKGEKKILALVEDAVVPTDRLVEFFQGIYDLMRRSQVSFVIYGHIAKGLLHTRPLLNTKDPRDVGLLRTLADGMFELVHRLGGSVSGEHGDGRLRSAYLGRMYPEIFPLFKAVKAAMDPDGILNPDIKSGDDPGQMQRHLRYGAGYRARFDRKTRLRWPEGFLKETEKCHGCTQCTTLTTATRMCPVFKFTRDEAAAPKAKANVLRALISGAIDQRELFAETFQKVIRRCANCGSCAKECPSHVNIPKLAMEARAQYVLRFGPSVSDRVLTGVESAGRLASGVLGRLQALQRLPAARRAAERLLGVSARRLPVVFSPRPLGRIVRPRTFAGRPRVLYFAGCYATYIQPSIGEAAVRVLEHMGMTVWLPEQHCCGLPMLSKGMIAGARRQVTANLDQWARQAASADHVVVTCSSCGYALMQDWSYLTGHPLLTAIQKKTVHISSLIGRYRHRLRLGALAKTVAYHAPCHLKIQPDPDGSIDLLRTVPGLGVVDLAGHCCGMIGSWGMSADNIDLSRRIASPMITALDASGCDFGVTDCPTCRMQMEAFGGKPVRHPVEILASCISQ